METNEEVVQGLRVKIAQIETSLQWIIHTMEEQKDNMERIESIDHALSKFITEIGMKEKILWATVALVGVITTTVAGLFDLSKVVNCLWH